MVAYEMKNLFYSDKSPGYQFCQIWQEGEDSRRKMMILESPNNNKNPLEVIVV